MHAKNKTLAAALNIFIVLITIAGVVASLGLGAGQFVGGVNAYFDLHLGTGYILLTVLLIGYISTASAITGINKAIKFLADFDMILSILLMLYIACFLHPLHYFATTAQAFAGYLRNFISMSTATGAYQTSDTFLKDWTVFYWAFWIAWVPFTGIFIARISRGRTIREYLVATIIVPTLATLIWFSVFGNKAFETISAAGEYHNQYDSVFTSLFNFLREFPLSQVTIVVTALLVLTSIINSVDSAIFVLGMFSDGGKADPQKKHKVIWGAMILCTALGLIAIGKEDLLNAVSSLLIILALPFSMLYVYMIAVFLKTNFLTRRK